MELTEHLLRCGFDTTQATVSRDIKELRLIKASTKDGKSKYAVAHGQAESGFSTRLRTIFREGVLSYDYAQNIVVIHTLPGLASAACSAVDGMDIGYVVGTIAGDDTGLILMRDSDYAREFCEELRGIINRAR